MTATELEPKLTRARVVLALALFALAATLRLIHLEDFQRSPLFAEGLLLTDARYFDGAARDVAAGAGLNDDRPYFLAPLYPYLLGVVYRLALESPERVSSDEQMVRVRVMALRMQCLLGALNSVLVMLLASRMFGIRVGCIAGLLGASHGVTVYQDALLLATCLNTFVNLCACHAVMGLVERPRIGRLVCAGLVLGVTGWAHGAGLMLVGLVPAWLFWERLEFGATWRSALRSSLGLLAPALLVVGAATLRNVIEIREPILITANGGLNLYIGNAAAATGSFRALPQRERIPGTTLGWYMTDRCTTVPRGGWSSAEAEYMRRVLEFVRNHPKQELTLLATKLRLFINAVEVCSNDHFDFQSRFSAVLRLPLPTFGCVGPLGLAGLILLLRRGPKSRLLVLWFVSQVVTFTIFFVLSRYRLVALTCLQVGAAFFLYESFRAARSGQGRKVSKLVLLASVCAVCVHWPIHGFTSQRGMGEQYRLIAEALFATNQSDEAVPLLEESLLFDFSPWEDRPSRIRVYRQLEGLYRAAGQTEKAVAAAAKLSSLLASDEVQDNDPERETAPPR